MSDLSVWHPEEWINGRWLAVRYRPLRAGVVRQVFPLTYSMPTYFDTEAQALARCYALNRAEAEERKPR